MKVYFAKSTGLPAIALSMAAALVFLASSVTAQNPELQQRIAEIKQASAANKQALARYTWQESQTTSIKGDVKKQQLFQVSVGDGRAAAEDADRRLVASRRVAADSSQKVC